MPLVSESTLNALRAVAYQGLDTPIIVMRSIQVETDFGSDGVWAMVEETNGWLREMSSSRVGEMDGYAAVVGMFRLDAQVTADILPGDRIVADGKTFVVNETNGHNTIRVFCKAILRRVE